MSDFASSPSLDDCEKWPKIKLLRLRLNNFCRYKNAEISFVDKNTNVIPLSCVIGPNGTGKTTILNAISMLCSSFEGYDDKRFRAMMLKSVRNSMNMASDEEFNNADFTVEADFWSDSHGEYKVGFNRNHFFSRHPDYIEINLSDLCILTRFDEELRVFQVRRDRWPIFRDLFSAITGFPIEEEANIFDDSTDSRMNKLNEDFVLGFRINKGDNRETITHRQCSSGERKIAKCFSTILNRQNIPSIVLIDNATMHVETGRHISVINSLEKCFPDTQMIVTCHSVPVAKSLPRRERLVEMRFLDCSQVFRDEPWRMRVMDDLIDAFERINLSASRETLKPLIKENQLLRKHISEKGPLVGKPLLDACISHLSRVPIALAEDMIRTPMPRISPIS